MFRGGLAIMAMLRWSQGPLQSPTKNVKKGPFGFFVLNVAEALIPIEKIYI
jgi:hypothetical protein